MKKILKFLASLKLAVIVILSIATITAIGTFVEARYDAYAAGKLVYKTGWMYAIFILLSINLIAVMVDRWPWKTRHLPFLFAHVGIIVLLIGSFITMEWGLDGNLRIEIGKSSRFVSTKDTDFAVHSSFDGTRYTKMFEQEVDFYKKSPAKQPLKIDLSQDSLEVVDYKPYVLPDRKIIQGESARLGSAFRVFLHNDRVSQTEWLLQRKPHDHVELNLGPARIIAGEIPKKSQGGNEIYLDPQEGSAKIRYALFKRDQENKPAMTGVIEEGGKFTTPWMGIEFQLLRYFARAEEKLDFKEVDRPSEMTTSAIHVKFHETNKERDTWVQLNDVIKLFTDRAMYLVVYANRRIDLGFEMKLEKFEVGRYPGTMRAASYQSVVSVPGLPPTVISMNEPLKYNGLTFYQASFQQDEMGKPVASILSVNYDPGRWIKYLGSLIMSAGVVLLFWFKRLVK